MKKLIPAFIIFFVFLSGWSHAELTLMKTTPDMKNKIKSIEERVVRPYSVSKSLIFGSGITGVADLQYSTSFSWIFNNFVYYSNVTSFVVDKEDIPECKGYPKTYEEVGKNNWNGPANCDTINSSARQCHLFMLNENSDIAGVGQIFIAREKNIINGKPNCIDVKAIAIARTVPDSFLITLSYLDSAEYVDPKSMPDEYPTTVLLRLKEESPGKLTITQDDSCLGNPNRIASIAAARKRLEQCAKESK